MPVSQSNVVHCTRAIPCTSKMSGSSHRAHGTETSRAAMPWCLFAHKEIGPSRVYKGSSPAQLGFGGVVLFGSKSVSHRHAALSEPVQLHV